jgi:hypothetical protein
MGEVIELRQRVQRADRAAIVGEVTLYLLQLPDVELLRVVEALREIDASRSLALAAPARLDP